MLAFVNELRRGAGCTRRRARHDVREAAPGDRLEGSEVWAGGRQCTSPTSFRVPPTSRPCRELGSAFHTGRGIPQLEKAISHPRYLVSMSTAPTMESSSTLRPED